MKLKPEEFKSKTAEILANPTDTAKVSTLLAELSEHNDDAANEVTTITAANTALKADNEKLRQANMTLFLKVGEPIKPADQQKPADTTPKFDDLFDANGNLK